MSLKRNPNQVETCSRSAELHSAVSPFVIGKAWRRDGAFFLSAPLRVANPRYSRIHSCATVVAAQAALGSSMSIRA